MPSDDGAAARFNAAAMELGALVCTARSPRCGSCPVSAICAWRAAGYPDTGDTRKKQAKYEGSDRQARGAILAALREIEVHQVSAEDVIPAWPDPVQRDRAIDSLVADGLIEAVDGMLRLPR